MTALPPPKKRKSRGAQPGAGRPAKAFAKSYEWPRFDSQEAMSGALGIPLEILRAAGKEGCPFVRNGRCDPEEFIKWWFGPRLGGEEQENWTRRDKRASALTKEFILEERKRSSIPFDSAARFIRHLVAVMFAGELDRMAQELPATMKGRKEAEIRKELLAQRDRTKAAIFKRLDQWEQSGGSTAAVSGIFTVKQN